MYSRVTGIVEVGIRDVDWSLLHVDICHRVVQKLDTVND